MIHQSRWPRLKTPPGHVCPASPRSSCRHRKGATVQMRIDRNYNDLTDSNQFYCISDHWNFGRLNVPLVFFFTGVHEDYHHPTDEIDEIDFEKYSRLVRIIYASTVKVANFDGRPQIDNEEFIDISRQLPR